MRLTTLPVKGAYLLELTRHHDKRGFLQEVYNHRDYPPEVANVFPVQQNTYSFSQKNVLRGIHCSPYAKLISCVHGKIYDVIVDLRPDSPTFLKWSAVILDAAHPRQVLVPPNCGHGFYILEDALVLYCQAGCFEREGSSEKTFSPFDPLVHIHWPVPEGTLPELSAKDTDAPLVTVHPPFNTLLPHRQRVLVIGATGQVGGALKEELGKFAEQYSVFGTYHSLATEGMVPFDLQEAARDPSRCEILMTTCRPHVVCLCAAYTAVDGCEKNIAQSVAVNHTAVLNIARAAKTIAAKLVFYSTDYVFDDIPASATVKMHTETSPTNPLNIYGKHKLKSEQDVLATLPTALILRTSRVYGPENHGKNMVYQLVKRLRSNDAIKCLVDEVSCATYNRDVAKATRMLVDKGCSGIYHCAGPKAVSKYKWGVQLAEYFQLSPDLILGEKHEDSIGVRRPKVVALDTTKLRNELPGFTFRGLWEALEDWKTYPHGLHFKWPKDS